MSLGPTYLPLQVSLEETKVVETGELVTIRRSPSLFEYLELDQLGILELTVHLYEIAHERHRQSDVCAEPIHHLLPMSDHRTPVPLCVGFVEADVRQQVEQLAIHRRPRAPRKLIELSNQTVESEIVTVQEGVVRLREFWTPGKVPRVRMLF